MAALWQQLRRLANRDVSRTSGFGLWSVAGILLLPALGCLLLLPLRGAVSPTDVAMLMLLWISAMALQFGKAPAMLTTLWSVLLLNWCFVPPYYTLVVHDTKNLISFLVSLSAIWLNDYAASRQSVPSNSSKWNWSSNGQYCSEVCRMIYGPHWRPLWAPPACWPIAACSYRTASVSSKHRTSISKAAC